MGFDEKVEKIYLEENHGRTYDFLNDLINSFPKKYKLLVGLRASFIKWDMISERKLSRQEYETRPCGLCHAISTGSDWGSWSCENCPASKIVGEYCIKVRKMNIKDIKQNLFDMYMDEHKKWEK